MIDFNDICFIDNSDFRSLCDLNNDDFDLAKSSKGRLDKVEPIPMCLDNCNNVQRRIILYYKVFKYVWPDICTRRNIPRCIVHKLQALFPGDIKNFPDVDSKFY